MLGVEFFLGFSVEDVGFWVEGFGLAFQVQGLGFWGLV